MRRFAAGVVLLLALALGCGRDGGRPAATAEAQRARVVRVVDGDTVWLIGETPGPLSRERAERVRVLDVDTPEIGECGAEEARRFAERLLPRGSRVRVRADRRLRDRFGRLLLHVRLGDGTSYGTAAVRAGHARVAVVPPNGGGAAAVRAAEAEARAARRGAWARCGWAGYSRES